MIKLEQKMGNNVRMNYLKPLSPGLPYTFECKVLRSLRRSVAFMGLLGHGIQTKRRCCVHFLPLQMMGGNVGA